MAGLNPVLSDATALVTRIREEIPLTQAMQLAAQAWDGKTLVLSVPLSANFNDKGTAFAGSITALGSITGWAALTLWAAAETGGCQVAVYDARFSFRKPLQSDFTATVSLPDEAACSALKESIAQKGKGRLTLHISLADKNGEAATLEAAYALWKA